MDTNVGLQMQIMTTFIHTQDLQTGQIEYDPATDLQPSRTEYTSERPTHSLLLQMHFGIQNLLENSVRGGGY